MRNTLLWLLDCFCFRTYWRVSVAICRRDWAPSNVGRNAASCCDQEDASCNERRLAKKCCNFIYSYLLRCREGSPDKVKTTHYIFFVLETLSPQIVYESRSVVLKGGRNGMISPHKIFFFNHQDQILNSVSLEKVSRCLILMKKIDYLGECHLGLPLQRTFLRSSYTYFCILIYFLK